MYLYFVNIPVIPVEIDEMNLNDCVFFGLLQIRFRLRSREQTHFGELDWLKLLQSLFGTFFFRTF